MFRSFAVLLLLLFVSACTQYQKVSVDRQDIGGHYTVSPQITWSKFSQNKIEMWTVNGSLLEALRFFKGLEDGDMLLGGTDDTLPVFRSDMRETEIMEYVADSISRSGAVDLQTTNLRPAAFGSLPGFRFELTYSSPDGLAVQGMAAGAVDEGKLLLILFTGAQAHYFSKYRETVEKLIASVLAT